MRTELRLTLSAGALDITICLKLAQREVVYVKQGVEVVCVYTILHMQSKLLVVTGQKPTHVLTLHMRTVYPDSSLEPLARGMLSVYQP